MQGKRLPPAVLLVLVFCLAATGVALAMSSASHNLPWQMLATGSGSRASSNYIVGDTSGQSSATGLSASSNYQLSAGYWYGRRVAVTTSLPVGEVGVAYSQTLAVSGAKLAYTWSVSAGNLPDGLTLSSPGNITGKPTTAGTYGFTVRVKDSLGGTATTILSIAICDRVITLKDGWTLISTDREVNAGLSFWEGTPALVLKYAASGLVSATLADLKPVEALLVKMPGGGKLGLVYSGGIPGVSSKDLVAGWNLIGVATKNKAAAILSPLRYAQIGQQQAVELTMLVSQGAYNPSGLDFSLATLTDADWQYLASIDLSPFDGYWVYVNAAKSFGVVPP